MMKRRKSCRMRFKIPVWIMNTLWKHSRWSEDFGVYTKSINGAFFGIGSGQSHPVLHNPDYDFPDDILATAIALYKSIALITNNLR